MSTTAEPVALISSLLPALMPLLTAILERGGSRDEAIGLAATLLDEAIPVEEKKVGAEAAAALEQLDRALLEATIGLIFDVADRNDGVGVREAVFDFFDAVREAGLDRDEAIGLAAKVIDHALDWSKLIADQSLAAMLEEVDETLGRAVLRAIWWIAERIGQKNRATRRGLRVKEVAKKADLKARRGGKETAVKGDTASSAE